MTVFVVERYLVGWTTDEVQALVTRVVGADRAFAAQGVRHLRSLVMADDETCLCVFDGPDADTVRLANEAAGLPVDRVATGEVLPT